MRKTIMLAFATAILAVATIVTDLVRADAGPDTVMKSPVAQVQTTDVSKIDRFDRI